MEHIIYNAVDFADREALELQIATDLGKTPEKKDATITGTAAELRPLFLSHGQSVWGVDVTATDFTPETPTPRIDRGTIYKSSVNISKNNEEN